MYISMYRSSLTDKCTSILWMCFAKHMHTNIHLFKMKMFQLQFSSSVFPQRPSTSVAATLVICLQSNPSVSHSHILPFRSSRASSSHMSDGIGNVYVCVHVWVFACTCARLMAHRWERVQQRGGRVGSGRVGSCWVCSAGIHGVSCEIVKRFWYEHRWLLWCQTT